MGHSPKWPKFKWGFYSRKCLEKDFKYIISNSVKLYLSMCTSWIESKKLKDIPFVYETEIVFESNLQNLVCCGYSTRKFDVMKICCILNITSQC